MPATPSTQGQTPASGCLTWSGQENHATFNTPDVYKGSDACSDFNLGYASSHYGYDYYRGYYESGGTWYAGAKGWVLIYDGSTWTPLVTQVVPTTPLHAQSWYTWDTVSLAY